MGRTVTEIVLGTAVVRDEIHGVILRDVFRMLIRELYERRTKWLVSTHEFRSASWNDGEMSKCAGERWQPSMNKKLEDSSPRTVDQSVVIVASNSNMEIVKPRKR